MIGPETSPSHVIRPTGIRRRRPTVLSVLALSVAVLALSACASQGPEPTRGPDTDGGPALTPTRESQPQQPTGVSPAVGAVGAAPLRSAREEQPVPTIGVYATTSDSVGMELLARLREGIKNAGYFPSTNADRPLLGLHLLSTTPGERSDAPLAYYSVAWTTRDGHFITHMVGSCAMKSATECANALMVTTSQLAQIQLAREQSAR